MSTLDGIEVPQEMDLLVAFSDLTAFARFARGRSATEIFDTVSAYYELVGEIIEEADGKIVKFIGDAVLIVFAAEQVDRGVVALTQLKETGDAWLGGRNIPCRHVIKAHFGPLCCGSIGTRDDKKFDVFGNTVNTAAMLKSNGFAMTPQVFRQLEAETRKLFKKHTPPITYIPLTESHGD